MTEIKFDPKKLSLEITGHADYAEKGKDIVCSAVSILFYTLVESLHECDLLAKPIHLEMMDGEARIQTTPKEQYLSNVQLMFWQTLNGYSLLEADYPENVKLTIV